jgi:hypothetical protein
MMPSLPEDMQVEVDVQQTTRELGNWDYESTGTQITEELRQVYSSHNKQEYVVVMQTI